MALREQPSAVLDHGVISYGEREMNLLDILIALAKRKKLVFLAAGVSLLASSLAVLLLPNIYTATSKVLPPQQNQSATSALLQQLGPLSGLAQQGFSLKNSGNGELYVGILKSQTVADRLIDRFDLKRVYGAKRYVDARDSLESNTLISLGKEGFITIEVSAKDPKFAATIANAYVEELKRLSQSLAIGEASQRRLFYENQLQSAKEQLANAEVELKKTQEASGLIQLDSQAKAIIEAVASVRAEIAAREVQLHALRSFATEQNSDVTRIEQELAGLRIEQQKLERRSNSGNGDIEVATSRVPSVGLEYVRRLRDVKYYEAMFEILAKQYEAARLDEMKSAAVIQVLDPAIEPERKSGPHRVLIVLMFTILAAFVAAAVVILMHLGDSLYANPEQAERWVLLKQLLRLRNQKA
jgi:tyrosine-protein kinase Etk/Wzc